MSGIPGARGRRLELMYVVSTGQWALFRNCGRLALSADEGMDNMAARKWASSVLSRDVEWVNAVDAPDERCGYWVAAAQGGSA